MSTADTPHRATCATLAAWLEAQRSLAAWSLAMTAVALAVALAVPPPTVVARGGLALVVLLGAAACGLALRLRLDEWLFRDLASDATGTLGELDASLAAIGLRTRAAATHTRPLDERIAGTQRLVRLHLGCVLLQTAVIVIVSATRAA